MNSVYLRLSSTAAVLAWCVALPIAQASRPAAPATWHDPSPHTITFTQVASDVRLEVLDWGGTGRPLVLLSGLGNTAHVFDDFAPKLTSSYHVFGITRRGFGASSHPAAGYDATRLADDVLAVLEALQLKAPVLAGHSLAGEELSSIGSRVPERVAGLIYLDAAYQYAFDNGKGATLAELSSATQGLPPPPASAAPPAATFAEAAEQFERTQGYRMPESEFHQTRETNALGAPGETRTPSAVREAIMTNGVKFTNVRSPVLVLAAMPQRPPQYLANLAGVDVTAVTASWKAAFNSLKERQLKSVEDGIPGARVVRVANAHHYIFLTNEAEVIREMRSFISTLP